MDQNIDGLNVDCTVAIVDLYQQIGNALLFSRWVPSDQAGGWINRGSVRSVQQAEAQRVTIGINGRHLIFIPIVYLAIGRWRASDFRGAVIGDAVGDAAKVDVPGLVSG